MFWLERINIFNWLKITTVILFYKAFLYVLFIKLTKLKMIVVFYDNL